MMARVICLTLLVGFSLGHPRPQELTLRDFAADVRPNGARSLGEEDIQEVLISSPYRNIRRQGRKGETNRIKFPTLTVENPNILAIGNPIQKVTNANGPVFNNNLSTKDIETKIKEINKKEEEKIFVQNEPENRAKQIVKDIELLEEVSLLEQIIELEQEVDEELIEIGSINLTPEIAQSDVLYNDSETEDDIISDVLYTDDAPEEIVIPVIVEEDNLEVSFIDEPIVDMIDIKIPALVAFEDEEQVASNADKVIEETTLPSLPALNIDTDSSVPERDFGLIQEV